MMEGNDTGSQIIFPLCVYTLSQIHNMSSVRFGIHQYILSYILNNTYILILAEKAVNWAYWGEVPSSRPCKFSRRKDASSSNCRSSAPPGAESINSDVLYKRHLKTQATRRVLGEVLISYLQDMLDESTEETINNLAVCACKNEIAPHGKVYVISTFRLHQSVINLKCAFGDTQVNMITVRFLPFVSNYFVLVLNNGNRKKKLWAMTWKGRRTHRHKTKPTIYFYIKLFPQGFQQLTSKTKRRTFSTNSLKCVGSFSRATTSHQSGDAITLSKIPPTCCKMQMESFIIWGKWIHGGVISLWNCSIKAIAFSGSYICSAAGTESTCFIPWVTSWRRLQNYWSESSSVFSVCWTSIYSCILKIRSVCVHTQATTGFIPTVTIWSFELSSMWKMYPVFPSLLVAHTSIPQ